MKSYIGSLLTLASMVAYSSAIYCMQPLELKSHDQNKTLVRRHHCNQKVESADLQKEPQISYDVAYLTQQQNYNYTLFLLEKNNYTESYKIHWLITDIVPINKSVTEKKRVVMEYKPAKNNTNATYTVLLYKHDHSLNLKFPSLTEEENFIPTTWAAPFQNTITLENNATFLVIGSNTSHPDLKPSGTIHPHAPTQSPTYPTQPTFQSPMSTTVRPHIAEVTEKNPGYLNYNTTNSSSTHHHSPSHSHKSGASSNVCSLIVIFVPIISIITRVMF